MQLESRIKNGNEELYHDEETAIYPFLCPYFQPFWTNLFITVLDTQNHPLTPNWLPALSLIMRWLSLDLIICLMVHERRNRMLYSGLLDDSFSLNHAVNAFII